MSHIYFTCQGKYTHQ